MSILTFIFIAFFLFSVFGSTETETETKDFEIVQKQTFSGTLELQSGTKLDFTLGYETMGTLNEQKSNAILICHYFSGTSHFAGKYTKQDFQPGYWDSMIGPGKHIDTNKYFVFSVDSLSNSQVFNPYVVTTGPASINPKTGEEWGLDFPVVTIRDFVETQLILMQQIGIPSLHAVMGASMGSYQALEFAISHPELVSRAIAVVPGGIANAWHIGTLHLWAQPILMDSNFNDGKYYRSPNKPLQGIALTLKTITFSAFQPPFFDELTGIHWANESLNPMKSLKHSFAIEKWLDDTVKSRALLMDANSILFLVRACQLFTAGSPQIFNSTLSPDTSVMESSTHPPILLIPSSRDRIIEPSNAVSLAEKITESKLIWMNGNKFGHLTFVWAFSSTFPQISEFINSGVLRATENSKIGDEVLNLDPRVHDML